MARKKKKLKLEQEFKRIVIDHKRHVIYRALLLYPELYNNKLLKKYSDVEIQELEGYEGQFTEEQLKVYIVEEAISVQNTDTKLYDKVYELCWRKIRKLSCDTEPIGI